jgi:hypothetical protein
VLALVRRRGGSGRGVGGCARAAEHAGGWARRSPTRPPRWAVARRNHGPSLSNVPRSCSLRACNAQGAFEGDADRSGLPTPASRARAQFYTLPTSAMATEKDHMSVVICGHVDSGELHFPALGLWGGLPAAPSRA